MNVFPEGGDKTGGLPSSPGISFEGQVGKEWTCLPLPDSFPSASPGPLASAYPPAPSPLASAPHSTPLPHPFHTQVQLTAFCLFEVMVGVFWPSMMTMRAHYVPEDLRSTIINCFR